MRIIILFTIATTLLSSCVAIDLNKNTPTGRYNIKDLLHYEELELKPDSTFNLIEKQPHRIRECEGQWSIKSKNELVLNGADTKPVFGADSLFYERLDCKNLLLKFESKNKIRHKTYYLKRMRK